MATQKKMKLTDPEPVIDNTNTEGKTSTLLPLLTICINFVAEHIHFVDTFDGLPDIIGEKIFKAAVHCGKFKIQDEGSHLAMEIFTSVYHEQVLLDLNMSGQHLGVNYCFERLSLFKNLRQLDLSDCGLGDSHEYLEVIAQMDRLTDLCIRNNCLSDKAIQRLTTPYRVFKRGPSHLHSIDISENEDITSKCIPYLNPFHKLQKIDITGTAVKSCDTLLKSWKFQPFRGKTICDIHTKGWAEEVVETWMKSTSDKASSHKPVKSNTSKFYSKSASSEKDKMDIILKPKLKIDSRFRLLLVRKEQLPCQQSDSKSISNLNDKRINPGNDTWYSNVENKESGRGSKLIVKSCEWDGDLMNFYKASPEVLGSEKKTFLESMQSGSW